MPRKHSVIDWNTLLSYQTTSLLYTWLTTSLQCQLTILSPQGSVLWQAHLITTQTLPECHETPTKSLLQDVFDNKKRCATIQIRSPQDANEREVLLAQELLQALAQKLSEALTRGEGFEAPEERWKSLYPRLIGKSGAMQNVFAMLDKIALGELTVLIQGENGSGKELVARTIHETSPRRTGPFVAQNCSALHDNLLDSELFGHKKGAFTGAFRDKEGLFATADRGTFFLDEVGEMSPQLQAKLLRVLETKSFFPVGSNVPKTVDVRVIAATHRDLRQMVQDGSFREDLFYRLHVVHLALPALRERPEDIPLLVRHFLKTLSQRTKAAEKHLSLACQEQLQRYSWPGNVRELSHELERLWVLAGAAEEISASLLSTKLREAFRGKPKRQTLAEAVETIERQLMTESLRRHRGNKSKAAEELGVSRRNFLRRFQALGLENKTTSRK